MFYCKSRSNMPNWIITSNVSLDTAAGLYVSLGDEIEHILMIGSSFIAWILFVMAWIWALNYRNSRRKLRSTTPSILLTALQSMTQSQFASNYSISQYNFYYISLEYICSHTNIPYLSIFSLPKVVDTNSKVVD